MGQDNSCHPTSFVLSSTIISAGSSILIGVAKLRLDDSHWHLGPCMDPRRELIEGEITCQQRGEGITVSAQEILGRRVIKQSRQWRKQRVGGDKVSG